jgi:hypothetical protein
LKALRSNQKIGERHFELFIATEILNKWSAIFEYSMYVSVLRDSRASQGLVVAPGLRVLERAPSNHISMFDENRALAGHYSVIKQESGCARFVA